MSSLKNKSLKRITSPEKIDTSTVWIPMDLMNFILRGLPVKSLLRFRCVSKSWCSLIDSPDFIKLHLQHSAETSTNRNLLVYCDRPSSFYFTDFDSFEDNNELANPLMMYNEGDSWMCSGYCNGIFAFMFNKFIILWNPVTREYKRLDPINRLPLDGFGYDSISDDYKYVQVEWSFRGNCHVDVYSLNADSWRSFECTEEWFPYVGIFGANGVFASNALHWLTNKKDGGSIAVFDFGTEKFREFAQPDYGEDKEKVFLSLRVLGECLCISYHIIKKGIPISNCIWIMKTYGVNESWTKIIVKENLVGVNESWLQIIFEGNLLIPIAFSNSGDQLLMRTFCGQYVWYDPKTKKFQSVKNFVVGEKEKKEIFVSWMQLCVGSLVKLKGKTLAMARVKGKRRMETRQQFELTNFF